uniref:Uncharacterized protein n=1 Tax=Candidatus Kentrum sp. SD TaxID=2126332 RepID=A0A451BRR3_9GAMM|nr:MAG: hypothetical protein BECKSD772D_GA0070982_11954 [Candidatus Kentron sp. SD]
MTSTPLLPEDLLRDFECGRSHPALAIRYRCSRRAYEVQALSGIQGFRCGVVGEDSGALGASSRKMAFQKVSLNYSETPRPLPAPCPTRCGTSAKGTRSRLPNSSCPVILARLSLGDVMPQSRRASNWGLADIPGSFFSLSILRWKSSLISAVRRGGIVLDPLLHQLQ